MRSQPSPPRSRTRGQRTATGPMPVMISRSGRCPWRTNRRRPSSVSLSAWQLSKLETSASTACARSTRAPLRKISVSGSVKVPGCESWKILVSVTAYHSFAGEVEASNTPTIRRLTLSRRHQLSPIARVLGGGFHVVVEAEGQDLAKRLATVRGVTAVEVTGTNHLRLLAEHDVRPDAAAAVVAAGGRLMNLSVEEPSLEAIYSQYFQHAASQEKDDSAM